MGECAADGFHQPPCLVWRRWSRHALAGVMHVENAVAPVTAGERATSTVVRRGLKGLQQPRESNVRLEGSLRQSQLNTLEQESLTGRFEDSEGHKFSISQGANGKVMYVKIQSIIFMHRDEHRLLHLIHTMAPCECVLIPGPSIHFATIHPLPSLNFSTCCSNSLPIILLSCDFCRSDCITVPILPV